jgi:hypothetical protein
MDKFSREDEPRVGMTVHCPYHGTASAHTGFCAKCMQETFSDRTEAFSILKRWLAWYASPKLDLDGFALAELARETKALIEGRKR